MIRILVSPFSWNGTLAEGGRRYKEFRPMAAIRAADRRNRRLTPRPLRAQHDGTKGSPYW
jgi:hypothetical protein